jgi:sugar/nucleoside kinase (ribokinase family)
MRCLDVLKKENIDTTLIHVDPTLPTNYHYVLWYPPERTILVNHAPFPRSLSKDTPAPKWIYLSSLGQNTEDFHHEIAAYLAAHPETKLAFQPGTFQMKLGLEKLKDIYAHTTIFFCNKEEAGRILNTTDLDPIKLMDALAALGPKIVIVTDGIKGAYARSENGEHLFMPIYPHEPFERTGAGDAYASTITACLAMGKTLEEALTWAPINSMSVTLQVGAQKGLLSQEKIQEYLSKAPTDYKLQKL